MNNIMFEGDKAVIEINKQIYPKKAVENTLEAFSDNFFLEAEESDGKIIMELEGKDEVDIRKAGYQFLNYLLSQVRRESSKVNI